MTALLSAPWYFLAAFCLFGGVLIACAVWSLCCAIGDWLHRCEVRRESELLNPYHYCANETRIPKE